MDKLKAFLSRIGSAVLAFFKSPGGKVIRDAVAGAVQTVGEATLALLLARAKDKVASLDKYSNLSGDLKAAQVKSFIFDIAAQSGVQLSTSLANFILESAVQAVRGPQS